MEAVLTKQELQRARLRAVRRARVQARNEPPRLTLGAARAVAGIQKLFCGADHKSRLLDRMAFGGYNKKIQNPRTPSDWLSRDPERVALYNADPLCGFCFTVNGFGTLFELIARLHRKEYLKGMPETLPVLMVSGTEDPVGGYGRGVRQAYESLKEAGLSQITLKMYEGGRHELLNETNRAEVMQDILDWIEKTVLLQR